MLEAKCCGMSIHDAGQKSSVIVADAADKQW